MKFGLIFITAIVVCVLLIPKESFAKKKKSKKGGKSEVKFDSKTLKCLVCRAVVNEFAWAVLRVDPKKMTDTGTWRIDEKGENKRNIVSSLNAHFTTL